MFDDLKNVLADTDAITFSVKVRPSATKTQAKSKLADGSYKIDVAAVPEDNKANLELIRFLAGEFHVSKSNIEILSGQTNSKKIIRIQKNPV